ncbi:MAG: hypothetical protein CL897_05030 [Dehalococcoidia bacterium]|nr:hypothetical protein [Dehalococcoidia bacterium]|tara:strand:- start:17329 stop:18111 length:783 start_codon:yes stop_codon:yes gene_type:complete
MKHWIPLVILTIAGASLIACGSEPLVAHPRIFEEAPWTGAERLHYNLLQRENLEGRCILETEPEISPGITEFRRLCRDAGEGRYQDNGSALVDSVTLQPLSSLRVVLDLEEGDARHFATTYVPEKRKVLFHSKQFEDSAGEPTDSLEAERALPEPTDKTPAPAWYDDEELLWLLRGIPLQEGFQGSFTNVNASTGRVFGAEVAVEGPEKVTVAAGTFQVWKVRIETSTVTQLIWVDQEAPHRVVKARIERLTYELAIVEK